MGRGCVPRLLQRWEKAVRSTEPGDQAATEPFVTDRIRSRQSLVTGGAGFIGSHLATALLSRGDRVRVLDDLSSGHRRNLAEGSEFVEASILDERDVREAMGGCELLVHLAAEVSVPRSWEDP